jgi:hypothetical protein
MNSTLSIKDRKAIFANLKTEYIYYVIPFALLISVRTYLGEWEAIILSADWSLASCIMFGQITTKVSKAVADTKAKASQEHFGLYTAKRFFLVVASIAMYFGMLTQPSMVLGALQILLFVTASILHFSDGYATSLLQRKY